MAKDTKRSVCVIKSYHQHPILGKDNLQSASLPDRLCPQLPGAQNLSFLSLKFTNNHR